MKDPKVIDSKVVFGPCRQAFTHVFTKHSANDEDEGKFSTTIMIPKDEKKTVAAIEKAIDAAKRAGIVGKWGGKEPKKLQLPLADGDDKADDYPEFAGHWLINAKCKTRPNVVDKKLSPIVDEDDFYSGCWAMCSVTFFPYDTSGNRGVAAGLNNLMKTKDDDRFGGRASAESDFSDFTDEEDDDDDL